MLMFILVDAHVSTCCCSCFTFCCSCLYLLLMLILVVAHVAIEKEISCCNILEHLWTSGMTVDLYIVYK